tara:strand:- start:275 stop:511 length:237 start_codon:yes stop_codon:yes gene_type:complete
MKDDRGDLDMSKQIEELQQRVKELEDINDGHRELNGQLRVELDMWKKLGSELEKTRNLLQGYKNVINDLSSQLRKAGK